MRTIAIRVEDGLHQQLTLLAKLGGRTLTDELKQAVDEHLARRLGEVDISAEAKRALAQIDADAAERRKAIEGLLTPSASPSGSAAPAAKKARR